MNYTKCFDVHNNKNFSKNYKIKIMLNGNIGDPKTYSYLCLDDVRCLFVDTADHYVISDNSLSYQFVITLKFDRQTNH